jgi:hypothetical protein
MTTAAARRGFQFVLPSHVRRVFFLGHVVAAGLLAIAISGAICLGLSHAFGKNAIAGDSQSAHLSTARCLDLFEYFPDASSCSAAELAHHSDEIIFYRLGMAPVAAVVFLTQALAARIIGVTEDERRRQRPWHRALGVVAFGLASLALLSIGLVKVAAGSSTGTARWLSDGSVSLAFFALYAGSAYRLRRGSD